MVAPAAPAILACLTNPVCATGAAVLAFGGMMVAAKNAQKPSQHSASDAAWNDSNTSRVDDGYKSVFSPEAGGVGISPDPKGGISDKQRELLNGKLITVPTETKTGNMSGPGLDPDQYLTSPMPGHSIDNPDQSKIGRSTDNGTVDVPGTRISDLIYNSEVQNTQATPLNDTKVPRSTVSNDRLAEIKERTGERWQPAEGDTRFVKNELGVNVYSAPTSEAGARMFGEVLRNEFKGHGGIVNLGGASGAGKGTLLEGLTSYLPDHHVVALPQDWFQYSPKVRADAHAAKLKQMDSDPNVQPSEWTKVWNHTRNQNTLLEIRDAIDSGKPTDIVIKDAWHRQVNAEGKNFYDETIHVGPNTIVVHDAVYPVQNLPQNTRIDDLTVRLDVNPDVVFERFRGRTESVYGDKPDVFAEKMKVNTDIIRPSYQRYNDLVDARSTGMRDGQLIGNPHPHPVDLIIRQESTYQNR